VGTEQRRQPRAPPAVQNAEEVRSEIQSDAQ
jgi:hypothetical protein